MKLALPTKYAMLASEILKINHRKIIYLLLFHFIHSMSKLPTAMQIHGKQH